MRYAALAATLLLSATAAHAQRVGSYGKAIAEPAREPNLPAIGIDQRLGEQVPLDLVFRDEQDREITLGSCVGGKPTVLVLAYYTCPMLCNQVLNGVVEAVRKVPGTIGDDFNVVTVSFDPKDKPGNAAAKKVNYIREYGRPGADKGWHFLTGDKRAIDALCQAVGFRYDYDDKKKQYYHDSGIMILTPFGKLSQYFFGVSYFDPKTDPNEPDSTKQLEKAIRDASDGMTGKEVPPNELARFLCYEYDPVSGQYTFTIMRILRVIFGTLVICLSVWLIRVWRRPAKPALEEPAANASV